MEPLSFLDGISGYVRNSTDGSADKGIRLAVIDPAYNPFASPYPAGIPLPKVTFEGETTLSGKQYAVAAGFVPAAGQRVYMVPIGKTYLIAGPVAHTSAQGFYAEPGGGGTYGVEFGGGNYFDTDVGLDLNTDADIGGDLFIGGRITHGVRGNLIPEIRTGTLTMTTAAAAASITSTVNFSPAWPTGSSLVFGTPNINSSAGNTAGVIARTQNVTLSSFQIVLLQADAGRGATPFAAGFSVSVHWVCFGVAPVGT